MLTELKERITKGVKAGMMPMHIKCELARKRNYKNKKQMEILRLKTVTTKLKYSLKVLRRFKSAKERISDLEDRLTEIMEAEKQTEKKNKEK